jgi:hypothetical protein
MDGYALRAASTRRCACPRPTVSALTGVSASRILLLASSTLIIR